MLTAIHPKLPMRNLSVTREFYTQLGFHKIGNAEYDDYLMITRDDIEIHFFGFADLNPKENYGQVYIRTDNIDGLYRAMLDQKVAIHPAGHLQAKPWGIKEFSILDPDNNLLTFGEEAKR